MSQRDNAILTRYKCRFLLLNIWVHFDLTLYQNGERSDRAYRITYKEQNIAINSNKYHRIIILQICEAQFEIIFDYVFF